MDFAGSASHVFDGWPLAYLVASVILIFGLAVGRLVPVSEPVSQADRTFAANEVRHSVTVGRVTNMIDCEWEKSWDSGQRSAVSEERLPSPAGTDLKGWSGRGAGG